MIISFLSFLCINGLNCISKVQKQTQWLEASPDIAILQEYTNICHYIVFRVVEGFLVTKYACMWLQLSSQECEYQFPRRRLKCGIATSLVLACQCCPRIFAWLHTLTSEFRPRWRLTRSMQFNSCQPSLLRGSALMAGKWTLSGSLSWKGRQQKSVCACLDFGVDAIWAICPSLRSFSDVVETNLLSGCLLVCCLCCLRPSCTAEKIMLCIQN